MTEISSLNAMYPAERIAYARGRVLYSDYIENSIRVAVNGFEYTLPAAYDSADAKPSAYAFSTGDVVAVRTYEGLPTHIAGFEDRLWPFIPIPAEVSISADRVFSSSLFQETPLIESDRSMFLSAYEKLPEKECEIGFTSHVNEPAPDMEGRLVSVQTHTTGNVFSRLSKFYYNGEFIYETYNEETFGGVFNGTRSNIIAAYKDAASGRAFVIYQINTYTDWLPYTSGRVDFDFFIWSSTGLSRRICGGYSDIAGVISPATGQCIGYDTTGFFAEDSEGMSVLVCGFYICKAESFSAPASNNFVDTGDYEQFLRFTAVSMPEGTYSADRAYGCNDSGDIRLGEGIYADPKNSIYRKKR